jgi:hypothetical protein
MLMGDNLNEYLATAVTLKNMKDKNVIPTGRYKDLPAAQDSMEKTFPWLKDYVNTYRRPELLPAKKVK